MAWLPPSNEIAERLCIDRRRVWGSLNILFGKPREESCVVSLFHRHTDNTREDGGHQVMTTGRSFPCPVVAL